MCVAVPYRIDSVIDDGLFRRAKVSLPDGSERHLDLILVPDARVGDFVLAQSGFALRRISESDANASFALLRVIGDRRQADR